MKTKKMTAAVALLCCISFAKAQEIALTKEKLLPYGVTLNTTIYKEKQAIVLEQPFASDDQRSMALLKDINFHNGIIEIDLAGQVGNPKVEAARGFVGIAFRVASDTSEFELFYIRPTNGRANDQVRRNHSTQYVSYPKFPWEKLRKEFPEKYEAYADMVPAEWTKIKIEVRDETAKLYVNNATQPTLIVNDLKHGKELRGGIGLWIGVGTLAHFSALKITKFD
ncbi:MAG TPA: hypothetical protein VNB90_05600 [Cytophagaceae bacterium]|jgi:hypothetical protein|nr:hypothetical protein [Cytophagaceae bacterium]